MIDILQRQFTLLDTNKARIALVILTGIIGTLFLLVYNPLNVNSFPVDSYLGNYITIKGAGFTGALVLFFSQFILRRLFSIKTFVVGGFLLWVMLEFFIISVVFYFLFGDYSKPWFVEFFVVLEDTYILSLIPYGLAVMIIGLYSSRSSNSSALDQPLNNLLFTISDENDKPLISLRPEDLLMMRSEDNYVKVYFLDGNNVKQKLVRKSMKSIESELAKFNVLRVHRSFFVNLNHVKSVSKLKRKKTLRITHLDDLIPISAKYESELVKQLNLKGA